MKKILISVAGAMLFFTILVLPAAALTVNNIPYWDGVEYIDSSVWYDSLNNFLGIGTDQPEEKMHITEGTLLVDNPGSPELEGFVNNTSLNGACSVDVSNQYAFVTGFNSDRLNIINIADPNNPVIEGIIAHPNLNGAFSVDVSGMYAYVVGYESDGLSIINISNPSNPIFEGSILDSSTMDSARSVAVSGMYAYVVGRNSNSLAVINISDPTNPVLEGSLIDGANLYGARSVTVSGTYAYVAGFYSDNLAVVDISDPSSPTLAGSLKHSSLNGINSVYVSGTYAYVTSHFTDSLSVIDISNPANPMLVGTVADSINMDSPNSVNVSGKYAYVTGHESDGLAIVDISDPTSPVFEGSLTHGNMDGAYDVHVSGKYAYVANSISDSLTVLDIGGADVHAANIGDVNSNSITVSENMSVGNDLSVGNGLAVGSGGVYVGEGNGLAVAAESVFLQDLTIEQDGEEPMLTLDNTEADGGRWDMFVGSTDTYGDGVEHLGKFFLYDRDALVDRLVIDTSGNVGIGTYNPNYNLDVEGTISGDTFAISSYTLEPGDGSPEVGQLKFGDGTGWQYNFSRASDDVELMTVMDTGRIGINNVSPAEALDVNGNIVASGTVCDVNGCIGDGGGGSTVWNVNGDDIYYDVGDVGIGVSSPDAELHVGGNDGVLFTGTIGSGSISAQDAGTRMMWHPAKAAFRAGHVAADEWNSNNIGYYSIASGYSSEASGVSSVSLGDNVEVTGDYSAGFGAYNSADGQGSIVAGWSNDANGNYSAAFNKNVDVDADYATGFGYSTDVESYASFVVGRYNEAEGSNDAWVDTEPLFVIGNGTSNADRNDAFVVNKDGEIEITGDITSDGEICIGSGC